MGFIVATMAWTLGDFSGGHMNPAVSIAMAVLRKISVFRGKYHHQLNLSAAIRYNFITSAGVLFFCS